MNIAMTYLAEIDQPAPAGAHRRLSCGVLVMNAQAEILLCHVTGQDHWDLPKGGIETGETPLQAALRETREETGLRLDAGSLVDLGRLNYRPKKDLHLFATLMPRIEPATLSCDSHFCERSSGASLPEMDGYNWVPLQDVGRHCTPRMTSVLQGRLNLPRVLAALMAAAGEPPASSA